MEYGNGIKNELIWKMTENKYHNADFAVDEDNVNVNVAMLAKYVETGNNVLDIGCGEGKFGALISSKKCTVIGIDLDSVSCEAALNSGHYKKVFNVNIEQPELTKQEYEAFEKENLEYDRIALIDVLEHVMNPTALVCNAVRQLKDGGKILVSIPNVNNGDIFLNLLRDRFNYREAGVLDNTHTKYFTKHSFVEWIQQINETFEYSLNCEYVGSTFGYTDYMEKIKEEKPKVYQFIQQNPYFHVMQHLFVLTYHKNKDEADRICLKNLLEDSQMDLTDLFERQLSFLAEPAQTKLLPNERQILEEEVRSAESGWEICTYELKEAAKKIEEQETVLKEAKKKIEEQETVLKEAKKKTEEQEIVLKEAAKKIEEQEAVLKEASGFQAKLQNNLKIALEKIERQETEIRDYKKYIEKQQEIVEEVQQSKVYKILRRLNKV